MRHSLNHWRKPLCKLSPGPGHRCRLPVPASASLLHCLWLPDHLVLPVDLLACLQISCNIEWSSYEVLPEDALPVSRDPSYPMLSALKFGWKLTVPNSLLPPECLTIRDHDSEVNQVVRRLTQPPVDEQHGCHRRSSKKIMVKEYILLNRACFICRLSRRNPTCSSPPPL